jgi:hypothetical protein
MNVLEFAIVFIDFLLKADSASVGRFITAAAFLRPAPTRSKPAGIALKPEISYSAEPMAAFGRVAVALLAACCWVGAGAQTAVAVQPRFDQVVRDSSFRAVERSLRLYDAPGRVTTAAHLVATKPGGKTEIWRAVEPDELADLIGSGKYRPGPGNEGKYFFPTKAQAKNLADNILPGRKFCITSGCIDSSVLAKIDKIYPAGEGQAWFIPNELLPYIDNIVVHGPA